MAIGLSTYSFFWRASDRVPQPMDLPAMLQHTADLGATVFQICDYAGLEALSPQQLRELRQQADALGLTLELGTRGLRTEHLLKYLGYADILGAKVLRSMFNGAAHRPSPDEAFALLETIAPRLAEQGVRLALETYEQVPSSTLLAVVERLDSPWVGICLDPGNCVAALELPQAVIDRCAARTLNLHVKDFAFSRRDGWVGFTYAGCPLGEGLLDYDYLRAAVQPEARGINQIIEHWLPWQLDAASTCALEDQWTRHNLDYLNAKAATPPGAPHFPL
ncbi:sugar phosphate isomerase/epimerase family protein [Pseudomonas sp. Marseille-Q5115]|uniref:sugar phosphate isomerase/epimerase family protein n=1 Tax=Pseudomonas sp. Marseille-Q5115 TaxID=2866593 RepID=UPI001CE43175|nr:sugar phosphate isomerase/epimerase family protein [Pseudomonas sp. Marseille-Q5115]